MTTTTTNTTPTAILLAQTFAVSSSLLTAGTILSLSIFDAPLLASTARSTKSNQPTPSATLPAVRFIFSRGSHLIPEVATFASSLYGYLWYTSPPSSTTTTTILGASNSNVTLLARTLGVQMSQPTGYLLAAALCISIAPVTLLVMLPAANQRLREMAALEEKGRGAEVDPMELKTMVERFGWLNGVRGVLCALGGVVGVMTVLG